MPRRGKKIVDASRKVDTSLETSIDTSQNLNDSRACSTPLTIDEREEDSPSSRPDSQNNGTNGPNLCGGQLDNLPSPRRKGLRSRTEVGPPNRDSLLERTLVKERHIRKTRQSCKKNPSTVTPVVPNEKGTRPAPETDTDIKSTFASNLRGLTVHQFDNLIKNNGMKLVTVPGNGFCFLSCILVTLAEQGINKSLEGLSVEIMHEITENVSHYEQYGNKEDMGNLIEKCADYFQRGCYVHDAVDICIGATANALGINIHVLQKSAEKRVHMSSYDCMGSSSSDIYLQHYPSKLKGTSLDAHYNCYVNKEYYKKNAKSISSRMVRNSEGDHIDSSNTAENVDQT